MLLVVVILTPGLLLGFLVSPWFLFILFALLFVVTVPFLVPRSETTQTKAGRRSDEDESRLLIWILVVPAILICLPVLIAALLYSPFLVLFILLLMAPLLWIAFGPSS
jgi:hypothetical protein